MAAQCSGTNLGNAQGVEAAQLEPSSMTALVERLSSNDANERAQSVLALFDAAELSTVSEAQRAYADITLPRAQTLYSNAATAHTADAGTPTGTPVTTLQFLAAAVKTAGAAATAAAIPPLVTLLSSSRDAVRLAAVSTLAAIALHASDDAIGDGKQAIVDAGGIPALLQLLSSDCTITQVSALEALLGLARDNEQNMAMIVDSNGVAAVMNLMSSAHSNAQYGAAAALFIMSDSNEVRARVASNGGMRSLLKLVDTTDSSLQTAAAAALIRVACTHDNWRTFAQEARISVFINWVANAPSNLQLLAANAFADLAHDAKNVKALHAVGAIDLLQQLSVASVVGSHSVAIRAAAVTALINCIAVDDSAVQRAAATALSAANLTYSSVTTLDTAAAHLVLLLRSSDAQLQRAALAALKNVTSHCGNHVDSNGPGVQNIVALLSSSDAVIQKHAVETLGNVARFGYDDVGGAIVCSDGIRQMLLLLSASDAELQRSTALALQRVAQLSHGMRVAVVDAGGMKALMQLVVPDYAPAVQVQALRTVRELAHCLLNHAAFVNAGGMDWLERTLASAVFGVRHCALALLYVLSVNDNTRIAKGVQYLLPTLVRNPNFDDDDNKELVVEVLLQAANNKGHLLVIAEAGGIAWLAELLSDARVRYEAMHALYKFAASKDKRVAAGLREAVPEFVRQLSHSNLQVQLVAANLLQAVARNASNHACIIDNGGLTALTQLTKKSDYDDDTRPLQDAARDALCALASSQQSIASIAAAGGIEYIKPEGFCWRATSLWVLPALPQPDAKRRRGA